MEGEGIGVDSRLAALCACGCGEPLPEHYRAMSVIRGHGRPRNIICDVCSEPYVSYYHEGHWTRRHARCEMSAPDRIERIRIVKRERHLVPAEPVFRVLKRWVWEQIHDSGDWPPGTLPILARALGLTISDVQKLRRRQTLTREYAARLLALAGGLPRTPTRRERVQAKRDLVRDRQRDYRRRKGEVA